MVLKVLDLEILEHPNLGTWVHRYWLQCRNEKNERRQNRTDGKKVWACSMRAGGGTARGHGECGAGTQGGAGPQAWPALWH